MSAAKALRTARGALARLGLLSDKINSAFDADGNPIAEKLVGEAAAQVGEARMTQRAADVCVYGATPGGILAAIGAARAGKLVELVNPDNVFGGMAVMGGLAYTDRSGLDVNVFKGLTNTIYRKFWSDNYQAQAASYPVFYAQSLNGEPAALGKVLTQYLADYRIIIRNNMRVNSATCVEGRITSALFEDATDENAAGLNVVAKEWIDATYEGDLMAAAGCSFTVGREGNAFYGEQYNGVIAPYNYNWAIDPYVTPGVPASGLLPGVNAVIAPVGTGDERVQAYSFRVNVVSSTGAPGTFRPFPDPDTYNPMLYEALGRQFEQGAITAFADSADGSVKGVFNAQPCKNGLTDLNQGVAALVGLDFVGHADLWPTGSVGTVATPMKGWDRTVYATRGQIYKDHVNYTLGLFKFLREDPRTPTAIKQQLALYGLPPFSQLPTATGLPAQLYVREGRRLVGDFVQLDKHCLRALPVTDGICVGYYAMDSHHCQLGIVNGAIATEGGFFVKTGPVVDGQPSDGRYWISKLVMLPKRAECTNLSVIFALSASHAAFASLRLEPVCMQLGEAAGFMAAYAIDKGVALHDVPSYKVREALGFFPANAKVLDVPAGGSTPGTYTFPEGRIVTAGPWKEATTLSSATEASIYGPVQLSDGNANKGGCSVSFEFNLDVTGVYTPAVFFPEAAGQPTAVPVDIIAGGQTTSLTFNSAASGNWQKIPGTFAFTANDPANNRIVIRNATPGFVKIDAASLTFQYRP